ncbi:MAG TPA: glycosyltransferase [Stellaceae bacterium]|nr:glycosyltransferase [Stellaceae bacterium]
MKTLVLTLEYPSRASYYDDWRDAFLHSPLFDATVRNIFHRGERRELPGEIGAYDVVVLLHSCTADTLHYASDLTPILQARRGPLVSFVGNEVNLPWAPLGAKLAWLQAIAPEVIATQLPLEAGEWLYGSIAAQVVALPHALNPNVFHPTLPQAARPIDIGARSYRYLAYLGDDDRNRLHDFFATQRFDPPLALDLSTEARYDRAGWAAFLNRCKATISTEAGSWYLERDDATVLAIREYAAREAGWVLRADSPLQHLARRLPYGVKAMLRRFLRGTMVRHEALGAERLDFAEVHRRFFADGPRAPVYSKCISSRHFDAIGCKTLQIMFPGRFNDILEPGEHYVVLARDFRNLGEVLALLNDAPARQAIVDRAYEHVMSAHTYAHRLGTLQDVLASRSMTKRAAAARKQG